MRENAWIESGVARQPGIADLASCTCGNQIFFNGREWDHVGVKLRHPPAVDESKPYMKASINWRFMHCDEFDL